jgi:hypothetical protein
MEREADCPQLRHNNIAEKRTRLGDLGSRHNEGAVVLHEEGDY